MFPSGSEYYLNKNGYTKKEHGGIFFSYQSSISKNIYYELSLLGGLAMVDEVQSSGDASGICNCLNGFMEPSIGILYHVTLKFSLGVMGGLIKAFSESSHISLSGLTAVLQF